MPCYLEKYLIFSDNISVAWNYICRIYKSYNYFIGLQNTFFKLFLSNNLFYFNLLINNYINMQNRSNFWLSASALL